MKKIFWFIMVSGRRRRCHAAGLALWLLRQIRDVENGEMWRCSDLLDSFAADIAGVSLSKYNAIEDEYLNCEYAVGFLDCAIEDLESAY